MRPALPDTSRAWGNPLCDDSASDSGSAASSAIPAQRQVSAELVGKGTPDQTSPALLDSAPGLAAHHSAHLMTSQFMVMHFPLNIYK